MQFGGETYFVQNVMSSFCYLKRAFNMIAVFFDILSYYLEGHK